MEEFEQLVQTTIDSEINCIQLITRKIYQSGMNFYTNWIKNKFPHIPALPITESKVRAFIESKKQSGCTYDTLRKNYLSGIRHHFSESNAYDPTQLAGFKRYLKALKRELLGDNPP